ncbi:helix-turn-helix domain-containing protein, partial [Vibrio cholerae]|uniref:helix-turn-helix domain-containing protein n=1 Tax=Vibrio cholerae TaxID=666 RepID=UPI0013B04B4C
FNKNKRIRITNKSCDNIINIISLIKVPDVDVDIFYKYLKDFGLLHTMFDYRENKDTFLGTDDRVYDYLLSLLPEEQVIKNTCLYFNISRSTLIRRLKKCNTTFKNIVRECRMDVAKEIIETKNLDIDYVSMIVG